MYVRIFWWVLLILEPDWLQGQTDHIHMYIHWLLYIRMYVCVYLCTHVGMIDWLINWFITDQSTDWLIDCGYMYIRTSVSVELCGSWEGLEVATLCSWTRCTTTERPVLRTQRETIFVQCVCAYPTVIFVQFFASQYGGYLLYKYTLSNQFPIVTYVHIINYPLGPSQQCCFMHVRTYVCTCIHRVVLSVLWTCGQAVIGSLWCCTLNAVN